MNMMGALLKQVIAMQSNRISGDIIELMKESRKEGKALDLDQICEFLKLTLKGFDTSFICVDALYEFKDDNRRYFLRSIGNLLGQSILGHKARLFVTGRPHIKAVIDISFSILPRTIILETHSDDIRKYVANQLEMDDNDEEITDQFKDEIINSITETAGGM